MLRKWVRFAMAGEGIAQQEFDHFRPRPGVTLSQGVNRVNHVGRQAEGERLLELTNE